MITNAVTTVRYSILKASVYWDRKEYLTVYISNGQKIINTIYIPVKENFLSSINGDKNAFIEEVDNKINSYLKSLIVKERSLQHKRDVLKKFVMMKVKNNIPFFLLKKIKNNTFL